MIVIGTVVSVELDIEVPKNGGGSYPGGRLTYRDADGAIKEKCFHNNSFKFVPGLKTALSNLSPGVVFEMEQIKEGEFLNVKSIKPSTATSKATPVAVPGNAEAYKATPHASPKSTYETPEERAKKQVYIVRQSSISAAIAYIGKAATIEQLLTTAKAFEAYVFSTSVEVEPDSEEVV